MKKIIAGIPQGDIPETVCETLRDTNNKYYSLSTYETQCATGETVDCNEKEAKEDDVVILLLSPKSCSFWSIFCHS